MGRMLEKLTYEDFSGRIGEEFRLDGPSGPLALVLAEATSLASRDGAGPRRSPFSLVFRGPFQPALPQRIWSLGHAALGRLEVFLVPIGPDGGGMRYEAVFN